MKFPRYFLIISSSFLGLQAMDGEDVAACSLQPRFALPFKGSFDFSVSNNMLLTLGRTAKNPFFQNVTVYDINGDEQVVPNYIEKGEYKAIQIAGNGTIVAIHAYSESFHTHKGDSFLRILERTKSGNSGNSSHWRQRGEDLRPVGGFCGFSLSKDGSVLNFDRCKLFRRDNTWSSVAYRYNGTDWYLPDDSCRGEYTDDTIRMLKTEPYMDGNGVNQVGRNGRIQVLLWNGCSYTNDGVVVGSARHNVLGVGGASLSKDGNVLAASESLEELLLPGEKYPKRSRVVQIFVRSSKGAFTHHTTLKPKCVTGVALSDDGKLLAVGCFQGPGSVSLFQWFPKQLTWQEVGSPVVGVSEEEGLGRHLEFNEEGSVLVAGTAITRMCCGPFDELLRVIDVVCDPSLPKAHLPRSIGGPQPANLNLRNPVGAAAYVFLLLVLGVAALVLYSHRFCSAQSETTYSYETVQVIHDKPPADEI